MQLTQLLQMVLQLPQLLQKVNQLLQHQLLCQCLHLLQLLQLHLNSRMPACVYNWYPDAFWHHTYYLEAHLTPLWMPPLMFDSREHHSKFRIMAYMYVYIYIYILHMHKFCDWEVFMLCRIRQCSGVQKRSCKVSCSEDTQTHIMSSEEQWKCLVEGPWTCSVEGH